MSIRLVLCLNAISWNAESIEVKRRLLRFLSCQLRFEGRITVAHGKPESCSVIVLKTIWPCWWRLSRHCVNCDTILFYCVLIYLTLQKFNGDRTRGICYKKLPFYQNKSSKVPSWTSCWYEWHCFLQGTITGMQNHFSTSLSKLSAIQLDWIMVLLKKFDHDTNWPLWAQGGPAKQMKQTNAASVCNSMSKTNRIPEWWIFLVSKTRRETACQWKDATKSFAFRWWWKPIDKVGNVLQCRYYTKHQSSNFWTTVIVQSLLHQIRNDLQSQMVVQHSSGHHKEVDLTTTQIVHMWYNVTTNLILHPCHPVHPKTL